jgi:hypothetical protein
MIRRIGDENNFSMMRRIGSKFGSNFIHFGVLDN